MTDLAQAASLLASLPPAKQQEVADLLAQDPALSLWVPSPGPQTMAYYSLADELFYGGAAGGGKSSLIVGLASTRHRRSLILRRESTQLRGILDDVAGVFGTRDGLNRQDGQWRIPPKLAVFPDQLIEFGGVPDPGSEEKHQGIAHDLLAFDEVTQFAEYIIDYLSTWNRSIYPGQRCRMILASNPPTPSTMLTSRGQATSGGLWLIRRYAPWLDPQYKDPLSLGPAAPGELRWFVTLDGRTREWPDPLPFEHPRPDGTVEIVKPKSRTFIPARVSDNPYLVATDYEATLQKLPEPLRSALLYGDFSVTLSDKPLQLFPTQWVRAATARWEELQAHRATPHHPASQPMTAISMDVSRGGGDRTILARRHHGWYNDLLEVPSQQTLNGASAAAKVLEHRRDGCPVVVDAAGVGASVYDHLRKNASIERLVGYVGSSKALLRDASGRYGFDNLRSQSYWKLREALDPSTPASEQLALPPDDDLVEELLAHTYKEDGGKLKITRKEDVTKLLGRSPDKADALVMAHTIRDEEAPAAVHARQAREERLSEVRAHRGNGQPVTHPDGRRASWSDAVLPYPDRT